MERRTWTRTCANYKAVINAVAIKHGITPHEVDSTIRIYLTKCKQLLLQGERITFPGILKMKVHARYLKNLRRFLNYKRMKKRYGDKEYFQKSVIKSTKWKEQ